MSKTTRYIPLNPKDIQLYRRQKAIEESTRTDRTNNALIALRRTNLNVVNSNPNLRASIAKLNHYIKLKKIEDVVKVINYLMSDLCND